jgi:toxin ParE1/3/4
MKRYRFSTEAKIDLHEIWEYIATDNPEAADRWVARIRNAIDSLARNPHMGHAREDLTDRSILFWPVGAYLILYRILPRKIEILAVTQGGRDIPSFLRRRMQ